MSRTSSSNGQVAPVSTQARLPSGTQAMKMEEGFIAGSYTINNQNSTKGDTGESNWRRHGVITARAAITEVGSKEKSEQSLLVIRAHFFKKISTIFPNLIEFSQSQNISVYVQQIMELLREFLTTSKDDPMTEVAGAFHDALAYENLWLEYTAEQYKDVQKIFEKILREKKLDSSSVEKKIMELYQCGFDLLPFSIDIDELEE